MGALSTTSPLTLEPAIPRAGSRHGARLGRVLLPGLLLLIGLGLRLFHLHGQSLWGDEACMLELSAQPAAEIVSVLAAEDRPDVDVAPPLYFLMLRAFSLVLGEGVVTARLMSALFGFLTLAAVYELARQGFDELTARYALALTAFSAFQVWYSQEARMYAMVTFLGVVSTWAFLRWHQTGRGALLYVGLATAALYTQYYAYLMVATHVGLALLFALGRDRRRTLGLLGLGTAFTAVTIGWLPVVFRDLGHASEPGFPLNFSLLTSAPFVFAKFTLFGNEAFVRDYWFLYLLAAPVAAWLLARGALALHPKNPAAPWMLTGLVTLPLMAVMVATSLGAPVYKSHPFILFSPFFYILVGRGLALARSPRGAVALGLLVGLNLFVLVRLNYGDVYTKPKVKEALAHVAGAMQPADLLVKLPAKIHDQPVQTGEILSWRYYTPAGLELQELKGADSGSVVRHLETLTADRSRFFLAVARTQFTDDLISEVLKAAQTRFRIVHQEAFPSRIRDFGLEVYLLEARRDS